MTLFQEIVRFLNVVVKVLSLIFTVNGSSGKRGTKLDDV